MNVKIPKTLTIYTDSVEMHEKLAEAARTLSVEKLAGVEFVWTSSSLNSHGVQATLTEILRVKSEWTGEGLPPAETVCEMHRETYFEIDWQPVTLLCVGQAKAFFRDKEGHEWSRPLRELSFRPIRTPEQIAAEEREKAICEMQRLIEESDKHGVLDQLGVLYDANYRKQPTDQ